MLKQTRLRTFRLKSNDNLSVPIGSLVWAEAFFERFGLDGVIRALKTNRTDLTKLAEAMVAYKAEDHFSILRCHEFMMQPPSESIWRDFDTLWKRFAGESVRRGTPVPTDARRFPNRAKGSRPIPSIMRTHGRQTPPVRRP